MNFDTNDSVAVQELQDAHPNKPESLRIRVLMAALFCGAAILLPNIFLFFLYNRNIGQAYIRYEHILMLAAMLSLLGLFMMLITRLITRSFYGAFIVTLSFWIFFWLFEFTFSFAYRLIPSRVGLLAIFMTLVFLCAAIIRIEKVKFLRTRSGIQALGIMVYVLFLFNFIPSLGGVNLGITEPDEGLFYTKQDFNISRALPSPDIYWIQMDGMLGFSTIERFFNDPQDNLRTELNNRGFVINDNAMLNAGWTRAALPTLFSPAFYDSYLGNLLTESEHLVIRNDRQSYVYRRLNDDDISIYTDIAPYFELFRAFMAIGYTTIQQTCLVGHGFSFYTTSRFHMYEHPAAPLGINEAEEPRNRFLLGINDIVDLMVLTTPLSIFQDSLRVTLSGDTQWLPIPEHTEILDMLTENTLGTWHERQVLRNLIDTFSVPSPKLVYAVPSFTHRTQWLQFFPDHPDPEDIYFHPDLNNPFTDNVYMNAHEYAAMVMLTMVDLILDNNPYAVIILQSDHGIHVNETQAYLRAMGMPDDELFEIIHSTISAIRIPQRYGGLDAPIAPINITRELVNRFVGHNYEMVAPHGPLGGRR